VEVNWRAVHIQTDSGLRIMPNSMLATTAFTNLSRPAGTYRCAITTKFSVADSPDTVCAMLTRVATAPQAQSFTYHGCLGSAGTTRQSG
jgi:small-conductance mechanosensitive channel